MMVAAGFSARASSPLPYSPVLDFRDEWVHMVLAVPRKVLALVHLQLVAYMLCPEKRGEMISSQDRNIQVTNNASGLQSDHWYMTPRVTHGHEPLTGEAESRTTI